MAWKGRVSHPVFVVKQTKQNLIALITVHIYLGYIKTLIKRTRKWMGEVKFCVRFHLLVIFFLYSSHLNNSLQDVKTRELQK